VCVFEVMLGTGIKNTKSFDETVRNQNAHDYSARCSLLDVHY